jgi:hypothetical protein
MSRFAFVAFLWVGLTVGFSQDVFSQSPYVFQEFKKGMVFYVAGDSVSEFFNYNGVTEEMIYQRRGERLALDDLDKIARVVLEGRVFVPFGEKFYEKTGSAGLGPFVRYKYRLIEPGKPSGYGGESQTTASTSYSSLSDSKMLYELKLPENYRIVEVKEYFFLVGGELQKVNGKKQLKKLFPDNYNRLLDFVKDQKVNFSDISDLNKLAEFIEK